jgi:hypothetical protein
MKNIIIIFCIVIAYSPVLVAEVREGEDELTGSYDNEELVRIATGTAKPIRFAPSVASVITMIFSVQVQEH